MNTKELTGYPSIDKPWLKYYSDEAINTPIPKRTIFQSIYENNCKHPKDTALLYFGKKITYKKLFVEIEKTAKAFVSVGVKQGDNVVLCMPAMPESIYSILALNRLGANAVMLNPLFSQNQLVDRIRETKATVLVAANELFRVLEKTIPQTSINTVISCPAVNSLGSVVKILKKVKKFENTIEWNRFIRQGKNSLLPKMPTYKKEAPAIMVYSSGTTGASKGIQLTNDGINATITEYGISGFEFKRQERFFAQIPIWFSTGIAVTMLVPLFYGVTVILEPIYDFKIFYKHITKYKPNHLVTAVGLIDYLISEHRVDSSYSNFKYLAIGGEYVTEHTERTINFWLKENGNCEKLHKGYGMCECGGTVTSTSSLSNLIGSSGIPTPHVTVAAFDLENGTELKYGERGEIRVLTPCRMSGYYKKAEATTAFFHNDNRGNIWACTGDMGYVTADGNVYVDGRLSHSYKNENGKTIYLFDIERAVLSVENVRQCKAVSSEIEGKVTHVIHIVLINPSEETSVIREIMTACREKLDNDHVPVWVKVYTDALPVSKSGKIDASELSSEGCKNIKNLKAVI